jgi:hypothetical protein
MRSFGWTPRWHHCAQEQKGGGVGALPQSHLHCRLSLLRHGVSGVELCGRLCFATSLGPSLLFIGAKLSTQQLYLTILKTTNSESHSSSAVADNKR